ncbi:hypothetical protein M5X16_22540 [Paenibacillus chitinolyticus]|uniref:Uncharacterized protein n=1 Tax=Paenibacillus chitinolyticus TaxID=79263 RepID=A0ABT4FNC4_9BACL|nr:hypothetical protein [Paenibacillus chitinolyticus]MCY9598534.1 hypothetical protein [Paenibacillus chitinolyticus]
MNLHRLRGMEKEGLNKPHCRVHSPDTKAFPSVKYSLDRISRQKKLPTPTGW